jgi:zinc transport system ATP-binding protein
LARALVSEPALLILDEPSTALDPETRTNFFQLLTKLNEEQGLTIIIITHDTAYISQYADKLLYLDKTVVFSGRLADFCHSPDMEKYFGPFSQHLICHQHN